MRGRRPKSSAKKRLAGNPGRRRLASVDPPARPAAPRCPAELGDVARAEWRRVVVLLLENRTIAELDLGVLVCYCRAFEVDAVLSAELQSQGIMLTAKRTKTRYPNPLLQAAMKARRELVRFAEKLGMTPADRSRVQALPEPQQPDGKARFFQT